MTSFSLLTELSAGDPSGSAATPAVGARYDAVLIAAQSGAEWAWTLLYRSVAASVLGYLRSGGDPAAEETTGEVFTEMARGVRTFGGDEVAFRVWAFCVARRHLLRNRGRTAGRSADPALAHWAGSVLSELNVDERDVVLLRAFGLECAGVSTVMGAATRVIRDVERRGRVGLKVALARRPLPTTGAWDVGTAASTAPNPHAVDEAEAVLAAIGAVPAVPDPLERRHVAQAVAAANLAVGERVTPPRPRAFHPVRRIASVALLAAAAAFAAAAVKGLTASSVVLAAASGAAPAADARPAPPAEAEPRLEQAATHTGFALSARSPQRAAAASKPAQRRAVRKATAETAPTSARASKAQSATRAAGLAKAAAAREAGAAHRAEGQARAAEARATRGPKTWTTTVGTQPELPQQAAAGRRATTRPTTPARGRAAEHRPTTAGHGKPLASPVEPTRRPQRRPAP